MGANVKQYMETHGLADEDLDRMTEPYECGDWESGGGPVHVGSHLDAVGKKRVTAVFGASTTQQVVGIARERGVKPSQVYRGALVLYLAAQA